MRAAAIVLAFAAAAQSRAVAADDITVATCLRDGYDIRAAFSDNNGGAYIILQKGTSAFMCHSNPSPRCEKLN